MTVAAVERVQLAGLTPDADAEVARLACAPDAIGVADLADVEVVAVEVRPLEARLAALGQVAVVEAVVQVERLRRGERRRDPGGRVVVAGDDPEHRRIDEDRRVDAAPRRRGWRPRGRLTGTGLTTLLKSKVGTVLPIRTISLSSKRDWRYQSSYSSWRMSGGVHLERVEAREGAGELVGRPAAELEEFGAERAARPAEHLLRVEVQVDDRQAVEPPLPGVPAAGEDAAGVADPEPAEPDSRVLVDPQEPAEGPVARDDVDGRRVAADRRPPGPRHAALGRRSHRPWRRVLRSASWLSSRRSRPSSVPRVRSRVRSAGGEARPGRAPGRKTRRRAGPRQARRSSRSASRGPWRRDRRRRTSGAVRLFVARTTSSSLWLAGPFLFSLSIMPVVRLEPILPVRRRRSSWILRLRR